MITRYKHQDRGVGQKMSLASIEPHGQRSRWNVEDNDRKRGKREAIREQKTIENEMGEQNQNTDLPKVKFNKSPLKSKNVIKS